MGKGELKMTNKEFISASLKETQKIGAKLGRYLKRILQEGNVKNLIIGLCGDLGGGKTTFIKGLATGLGLKKVITSPTFLLLKEYKIKDIYLYHFDFYRLKGAAQALEIGLKEYLKRPKSISVIEWADKIENILPSEKLMIDFAFIDQNKRKIIFKPMGKRYKELIRKMKTF